MKTSEKITAFLAIAAAIALQAGPASAGGEMMDAGMPSLPGPDALGLVAAGVVAAVYVARRLK